MSDRDVIEAEIADLNANSNLLAFQAVTEAVNTHNGWFDEEKTISEDVALLHSEVSELFEEHRNGHSDTEVYYTHDKKCPTYPAPKMNDWEIQLVECCIPKPEGIPTEAADLFIRLLDLCERRQINLMAETKRKLAYNLTRGYKHGGKVL